MFYDYIIIVVPMNKYGFQVIMLTGVNKHCADMIWILKYF